MKCSEAKAKAIKTGNAVYFNEEHDEFCTNNPNKTIPVRITHFVKFGCLFTGKGDKLHLNDDTFETKAEAITDMLNWYDSIKEAEEEGNYIGLVFGIKIENKMTGEEEEEINSVERLN